jgi:hypothetical protein
MTVALTQSGKPLEKADGIFVDVMGPAQSSGNLLAEWIPRTKTYSDPGRSRQPEKPFQEDPGKSAFNAALRELYGNPAFLEESRAKSRHRVFLFDDGLKEHGDARAGDGIYSGYLTATQVAGSYALNLFIQASSRCGRVTRTESTATLVEVAPVDPRKSVLTAVGSANGYTVLVAPADRFGNLLGPGRPESVEVYVKGARTTSELRDRLDGSYEQAITLGRDPTPQVTVIVNGKHLATVPLQELIRSGKGRY